MVRQLRRSRRLQMHATNAETQQVERTETNGANRGTVNDTHIHGEGENNGNCVTTNNENPQTVGDIGATRTGRSDVVTPVTERRRHPTGRPVDNDNDNTSVCTNFITPTSSIRDGARNASQSTGIRSNNSYNIGYFRQRESAESTCDDLCANPYTCNNCDKKRITNGMVQKGTQRTRTMGCQQRHQRRRNKCYHL